MRVALALGIIVTRAAAQGVPVVALTRPAAEFGESFTQVASIRELSDGRVYVADARDKIVALVDFSAQSMVKVGRAGSGPGEFAVPRRLFAQRADTTLLYDAGNGRLLVLLPDGKTGVTRDITLPVAGANDFRGVDERGRIFFTTRPFGRDAAPDEILVRFDPDAKRADTLGRLTLPAGRITGSRNIGGGMLLQLNNKPFAKEDVAAIGADGRAVIVHASDYHVEWISAGNTHANGPPVAYTPIPVGAAEKRAFLEGRVVPGQILVQQSPGATASAMPAPRGSMASTDALDDTGMEWPAQLPPFVGGAATIAADGSAWILRTRPHTDSLPSYDVFGADGHLFRRVTLPAHARLVGFGRNAVYLVRKDADDLEYLQRYALR